MQTNNILVRQVHETKHTVKSKLHCSYYRIIIHFYQLGTGGHTQKAV